MKKTILKTVVATAVVAATMVVSSVAAFAADHSVKLTDVGATSKTVFYSPNQENAIIFWQANGEKNSRAKFDKCSKDVNLKGGNSPYWVAVNADAGDTISMTADDGTYKLLSSEKIADEYDTQTGSNVTFKQIQQKGTYVIINTSDSSKYIETVSVASGVLAAKTTISGKVVDNSTKSPKLTIDGQEIKGDFSISVMPDVYDVVCDSDLVDVVITDSAGRVIENIDANTNVSDITITLTDKAVATLSGSVDPNLTGSGNIKVTSEGFTGTATIDGGNYSIEVPQNNTYTISLDENEGYIESQYVLSENTATVTTTAKTLDLKGEKITEWNFANLPAKKIEKEDGTYKGIKVTASNGKFDAQPTSNRVQFNAGTKAAITIAEGEKLSVTTSKNKCTVTYDGTTATITAIDQDYITSIKIIAKDDVVKVDAGAVYTDGADSYIIGAVKDVKETSTKFTVSLGGKSVDTDTVYDSVEINGTSITAAQVGGDYLYAVKITDANGNLAVNGFTAKLS